MSSTTAPGVSNERLLEIWKACKSIDNREFCVEFGRAVIAEMRITQSPELSCWFGKCTTVEACAEDGCKALAACRPPQAAVVVDAPVYTVLGYVTPFGTVIYDKPPCPEATPVYSRNAALPQKDDSAAVDEEKAIGAAMSEGNKHGVKSTIAARIVAAYLGATQLSSEKFSLLSAGAGVEGVQASMLQDLLARIHGDGGHYLEQHGLEKSLEDADQLIASWRALAAQPKAPEPGPVAVGEANALFAKLGAAIISQDNRATDAPIFIVQQKRSYVTEDDYNQCRYEWHETDSGDHCGPSDSEELERLERFFRDEGHEPKGWRRLAMMDVWEFVTACFTEQGCKDFIAINGHNLKEPRIYAESSFRNEEFRAIRSAFIALATPPGGAGGSVVARRGTDSFHPANADSKGVQKLWLWKNFVDGKPEYWAFDSPYPIHLDHGDPQTLGEPCGYAIVKPSRQGRTDVSEAEVLRAIARVQGKA